MHRSGLVSILVFASLVVSTGAYSAACALTDGALAELDAGGNPIFTGSVQGAPDAQTALSPTEHEADLALARKTVDDAMAGKQLSKPEGWEAVFKVLDKDLDVKQGSEEQAQLKTAMAGLRAERDGVTAYNKDLTGIGREIQALKRSGIGGGLMRMVGRGGGAQERDTLIDGVEDKLVSLRGKVTSARTKAGMDEINWTQQLKRFHRAGNRVDGMIKEVDAKLREIAENHEDAPGMRQFRTVLLELKNKYRALESVVADYLAVARTTQAELTGTVTLIDTLKDVKLLSMRMGLNNADRVKLVNETLDTLTKVNTLANKINLDLSTKLDQAATKFVALSAQGASDKDRDQYRLNMSNAQSQIITWQKNREKELTEQNDKLESEIRQTLERAGKLTTALPGMISTGQQAAATELSAPMNLPALGYTSSPTVDSVIPQKEKAESPLKPRRGIFR